MKAISYNLNKIDLFSKFFIFEEKEHQKFSTIGGIVLTFLLLFTCIIIGYLFGKEIYQRNNPTVMNSNERINVSEIKANEFPIFYVIFDDDSVNLPLATKYIDVDLNYLIIGEDYSINNINYQGLKTCQASDFYGNYKALVDEVYSSVLEIYDLYCILYSKDMIIKNDYSTQDSSYLNLEFALKDGNFTDEEIVERNEMMEYGVYVSLLYFDSFIDSTQYDSPITYYQKTNIQKLSEGLLQRHFFNIEKINFNTNQGWILDSTIQQEVMSIKSIIKDTSSSNRELFWVSISSPNIRTKIIRSYMKVQDMLAKVGGFFNALYIFSLILTKNYVDFCFIKYIYSYFANNICTDDNSNLAVKNGYKYNTFNAYSNANKIPIDKVVLKIANSNSNKENNNINNMNNNINNSNNNVNNISPIKNINSRNSINNILNNNEVNRNNIRAYKEVNVLNNNNSMNAINNSNNRLVVNNYVENKNSIFPVHHTPSKNDIFSENKDNKENKEMKTIELLTNSNKLLPLNNNIGTNNNLINAMRIEESGDNYIHSKNNSNLFEHTKSINYLQYIWNDIICCKDTFTYQRKAVSNIISFENILEVSYKHYLENKFAS